MFVCSQNKLRSPTAEHFFADKAGIETLSAETNGDADEPLTDELVEWADSIFVMERTHRSKLREKHLRALKGQRVVVLDIPDEHDFMDPHLVELLQSKMRRWLPAPKK